MGIWKFVGPKREILHLSGVVRASTPLEMVRHREAEPLLSDLLRFPPRLSKHKKQYKNSDINNNNIELVVIKD